MPDVFGRQDQILRGGLSSDSMFLTWPELSGVGGGLGLLVQSIGLEYRQPIRRIFEIGPGIIPTPFVGFTNGDVCDGPSPPLACAERTQPTYYIIGRPEGRLQMSQFIGPNAITTCFYKKYGNPCAPNIMTMSGKAGCSATDGSARRVTWSLGGVTLDMVKMDITAQEMVIQAGITAMFASLDLAIQGDDGLCGATAPVNNFLTNLTTNVAAAVGP